MVDKKEYTLKVILKGDRKYKIKVKEILENGTYLLIDGSIVTKEDILEIVKE